MHEEILGFIDRFTKVTGADMWLNGLCYHFAKLLQNRYGGELYYHHTNHFMLYYDDVLYDASGDVTVKYSDDMLCTWMTVLEEDWLLASRIIRDCVDLR